MRNGTGACLFVLAAGLAACSSPPRPYDCALCLDPDSGAPDEAGGPKDAGTDAKEPTGLARLGHLVVIVMENHSFDNLYGSYPGAEGLRSPAARIPQVDGSGVPYLLLPQNEALIPPDLPNAPFDITRFKALHETTGDLAHAFFAEQRQIAGGRMNRYVEQNFTVGLALGYYPTEELPLARLMRSVPKQVTVLDHFFHAAYGGSFLNHIWLVAAATPRFPNAPPDMRTKFDENGNPQDQPVTLDGYAVNALQPTNTPHDGAGSPESWLPSQTFDTIGDRLNDAGVDWAWYATGWNQALAGEPANYTFHHQPFVYFQNYAAGTALRAQHLKDETDFRAALASGNVPPVSFFKPGASLNQHPGNDLLLGENYVLELVQSIMKSSIWKDAAVIVTYDENGGYWDHVPPPAGDRFGPGTRIPAIVFSPFAKGGVDSTPYDTTAILKLIESRWRLPPLTARDAAQADMSEHAFDFEQRDGGREPPPSDASDDTSGDDVTALKGEPRRAATSHDTAHRALLHTDVVSRVPPVPGGMLGGKLSNPFAYIPPQCYAKTRTENTIGNSCYPCHQESTAPNFADDARLQLGYEFQAGRAVNPWQNVFAPPRMSERATDAAMLAYVRESNYFDADGRIALRARLADLPASWDSDDDGRWDGFVPDAWFRFDDRGFDLAPDGRRTGWRALAYYSLPGVSFPWSGSLGDVLIRLDPVLREDKDGREDRRIYEINLAIVEALVTRRDVTIDPIDERAIGVDLDLDGQLGQASRIAFDAAENGGTRMRYAGIANDVDVQQRFHIAPGLFPIGTEFLHSVRYLDTEKGQVVMAARMKELRYAKKTNWFRPEDLRAAAEHERMEQRERPSRARYVRWTGDRGVRNGQGWVLQGFIEAADGSLRPQSYEESVPCAGCHGGVGATADSIFSMARKVGSEEHARGWFHWTQRGPASLGDPRREDGAREYELYSKKNAGASDLFLPTPERALDLDRAYRAIVEEQSFTRGRDAALSPSSRVYAEVASSEKTGVRVPVASSPLAPRGREGSHR
ncbi:MAG: alkaline phosphatase family protein [Polyangiaceae bacterium]